MTTVTSVVPLCWLCGHWSHGHLSHGDNMLPKTRDYHRKTFCPFHILIKPISWKNGQLLWSTLTDTFSTKPKSFCVKISCQKVKDKTLQVMSIVHGYLTQAFFYEIAENCRTFSFLFIVFHVPVLTVEATKEKFLTKFYRMSADEMQQRNSDNRQQ